MLTVLLPDCRQVGETAITEETMECLDTVTQIRRLIKCVMPQGGILKQNKYEN